MAEIKASIEKEEITRINLKYNGFDVSFTSAYSSDSIELAKDRGYTGGILTSAVPRQFVTIPIEDIDGIIQMLKTFKAEHTFYEINKQKSIRKATIKSQVQAQGSSGQEEKG